MDEYVAQQDEAAAADFMAFEFGVPTTPTTGQLWPRGNWS